MNEIRLGDRYIHPDGRVVILNSVTTGFGVERPYQLVDTTGQHVRFVDQAELDSLPVYHGPLFTWDGDTPYFVRH